MQYENEKIGLTRMRGNIEIPSAPGTYAVIMKLAKFAEIEIGKLGTFAFSPGYYIYVGSAFGPGGLKARLGRHLRKEKKLKWHIDYITQIMTVADVKFAKTAENEECVWTHALSENEGTFPIKGFGASDCKCFSHLLFFKEEKTISNALKSLFGSSQ